MTRAFEELLAEGAAVPVEGWDFSWFDGRATEERPPWGYASLMGERMRVVDSALDLETGGGEVLATMPRPPALLVATESWRPNVFIARAPARLGGHVVAVADGPTLPFVDGVFELVVSRHPVVVLWEEIPRVLRPGGTYLSQQIGAGTNRELIEFMMSARPVNESGVHGGHETPPSPPASRLFSSDPARCAWSSSMWRRSSISSERCCGPFRTSRSSATRIACEPCTPTSRAHGSFVSTAQRMLVEVRRPA